LTNSQLTSGKIPRISGTGHYDPRALDEGCIFIEFFPS
jgi:hypothetical protein